MENRPLCYQRFLYMFCYIDLQIFTMSDPIIPPYPQYSETTVNGPPPLQRLETHPSASPPLEDVLAAAAVVPPRDIPSTSSTPPFVPYHEFEAMSMERQYILGQVRELERIIQMMDTGRAERALRYRIVDVRMIARAKLSAVAEDQSTYSDLVDWAMWMMRVLDTLGGPTFP